MELYFAGAEQPIYLRMLEGLGVTRIAISFYEWQKRHSTDDLFKHLPDGMEVVVVPGVARKEALDYKTFAEDYLEFCERNADQALLFDLDAPFCPPEIRQYVRDQLTVLPNVIVFPMEGEQLPELATTFERIGVNANMTKTIPAADLRRLQASVYGSNVTNPKTLRIARLHATTSMAWLSGRRYGELWVFARNKLKHYSNDALAKAVRIHSKDIEAFDVDPESCLQNDRDALTVLAVRSLQAMADSLSRRPRDRETVNVAAISGNGVDGEGDPDGSGNPATLADLERAQVALPRPRVTIPIASLEASSHGVLVRESSVAAHV